MIRRTSRAALGVFLSLGLCLGACEQPEKKVEKKAPVVAKAPKPEPAKAPEPPHVDDEEIPTTEDFEEEAFKKISDSTYKVELAALKAEIEEEAKAASPYPSAKEKGAPAKGGSSPKKQTTPDAKKPSAPAGAKK